MDVAAALKECPLFKNFTDTGLRIIATVAHEKNFPEGAILFAENMLSDSMFVVTSGKVRLHIKGLKGEEVTVGTVGPKDFIGEWSLVEQGKRMCGANAETAVVAIEIRHSDFQKLMGTKPQACAKLIMGMAGQLLVKMNDSKDALRSLALRS